MDVADLAVPGVRGIRPYQPGKPVEELEREYGVRGAVKLASNENPLGPPPAAVRAIRDAAAGVARYPDGNGFALKAALSQRLGLASAQITLGNGSNDLLELVARVFAGPGDEIVFSQYAFAVYPLAAQAVGARPVAVPARTWGHDLAAMAAAVGERTRVAFIANPNNPTGTWLTAAALRAFLASVPQRVIVVIDEAYFEYVTEPDYPDCSRWVDEFPNLVVTRTFSKIYGLAGLRLGYGLSSAAIADLLNRVRQPFNVNALAQAAGLAALADAGHVARSREVNRAGLRRLTQALADMGMAPIPSVANFVSFDTGRPAAEVYEALLRRGVIVRPVDSYGMPTFLRVTVGAEEENERFVDALREVMREEYSGRGAGS